VCEVMKIGARSHTMSETVNDLLMRWSMHTTLHWLVLIPGNWSD